MFAAGALAGVTVELVAIAGLAVWLTWQERKS